MSLAGSDTESDADLQGGNATGFARFMQFEPNVHLTMEDADTVLGPVVDESALDKEKFLRDLQACQEARKTVLLARQTLANRIDMGVDVVRNEPVQSTLTNTQGGAGGVGDQSPGVAALPGTLTQTQGGAGSVGGESPGPPASATSIPATPVRSQSRPRGRPPTEVSASATSIPQTPAGGNQSDAEDDAHLFSMSDMEGDGGEDVEGGVTNTSDANAAHIAFQRVPLAFTASPVGRDGTRTSRAPTGGRRRRAPREGSDSDDDDDSAPDAAPLELQGADPDAIGYLAGHVAAAGRAAMSMLIQGRPHPARPNGVTSTMGETQGIPGVPKWAYGTVMAKDGVFVSHRRRYQLRGDGRLGPTEDMQQFCGEVSETNIKQKLPGVHEQVVTGHVVRGSEEGAAPPVCAGVLGVDMSRFGDKVKARGEEGEPEPKAADTVSPLEFIRFCIAYTTRNMHQALDEMEIEGEHAQNVGVHEGGMPGAAMGEVSEVSPLVQAAGVDPTRTSYPEYQTSNAVLGFMQAMYDRRGSAPWQSMPADEVQQCSTKAYQQIVGAAVSHVASPEACRDISRRLRDIIMPCVSKDERQVGIEFPRLPVTQRLANGILEDEAGAALRGGSARGMLVAPQGLPPIRSSLGPDPNTYMMAAAGGHGKLSDIQMEAMAAGTLGSTYVMPPAMNLALLVTGAADALTGTMEALQVPALASTAGDPLMRTGAVGVGSSTMDAARRDDRGALDAARGWPSKAPGAWTTDNGLTLLPPTVWSTGRSLCAGPSATKSAWTSVDSKRDFDKDKVSPNTMGHKMRHYSMDVNAAAGTSSRAAGCSAIAELDCMVLTGFGAQNTTPQNANDTVNSCAVVPSVLEVLSGHSSAPVRRAIQNRVIPGPNGGALPTLALGALLRKCAAMHALAESLRGTATARQLVEGRLSADQNRAITAAGAALQAAGFPAHVMAHLAQVNGRLCGVAGAPFGLSRMSSDAAGIPRGNVYTQYKAGKLVLFTPARADGANALDRRTQHQYSFTVDALRGGETDATTDVVTSTNRVTVPLARAPLAYKRAAPSWSQWFMVLPTPVEEEIPSADKECGTKPEYAHATWGDVRRNVTSAVNSRR